MSIASGSEEPDQTAAHGPARRDAAGRPSQQERTARTREAIINSAAGLFEQLGYDAPLSAIIGATGMTKGAFYHHFTSKDELALAVFRIKQQELIRRMQEESTAMPDALQQLRENLLTRARLLRHEPGLRSFLRLASEMTMRFGPGSEFAASYELPVAAFTELVQRGQAEGVIRSGLDPRQAGETVFACLLGTDEIARVTAAGADLEQRTAAWLEVLLSGLAAP